ncbi:MAG TPA: ABC transporter substrate-binding protein [Gemmatimonadales bacterium]|nr:ABC transporter substrate-binding protein [Gemmatimonadales bacterium]
MLVRFLLVLCIGTMACGPVAERRGATVLYASGADLQSINPLFTIHPMARQVQRYVLLTTLVRRDSAMRIEPALARRWEWSGTTLRMHLFPRLRWHDGVLTTARDVAWTFERARDPATGYPRQNDLATLRTIAAIDDSTIDFTFTAPDTILPDVLTDLAILPHHLLDTIPPARLRQAAWLQHPVGNGPFTFVSHLPNRRWVFARNPDFPPELGGPPQLDRLVIAVVDEPMTKLAALTSGELDFASVQPAHAAYVKRNPAIVVRDYPVLFTTGIVFNTRRAPFTSLAARQRVNAALDRQELVDGFAYGYATPATGPVPPELGNREQGTGNGGSAGGPVPRSPSPVPHSVGRDTVSFELLTVGSGEAALEQMIQAQLAQHGIRVRIRQLELSAYLERVYTTHEFQAAVLGTPGDIGLGYLVPLLAVSGLTRPETTPAQLLDFYNDETPVAFLYHSRGVQGINRRVQGVELGLRGELASVSRWSIAP